VRIGLSPSRRMYEAELPLTSLIDVIFLLLIFFLLTSSFSVNESQLVSGLQVERSLQTSRADLQPQVINVELRDGKPVFRLGDRVTGDQAELTGILARLPKESGVFVRVSDLVPVEFAAAALQASKDAGFTKVSYVPAR
jgi:biopolymer transport protein ExbD